MDTLGRSQESELVRNFPTGSDTLRLCEAWVNKVSNGKSTMVIEHQNHCNNLPLVLKSFGGYPYSFGIRHQRGGCVSP
jgi:hypothetical protein